MDATATPPTAAPLTWHKSACNLCYINCGVELGVSGEGTARRIVKVRGDGDNPRSQGYLCNKAQAIPSYVHHRDRLTTPLRRRPDGSHEAIDWDTAVREIAERLGRVVAQHGGKAIAAVGGGGQGNHAGGSYAFGFLRALGSRTIFNALSQEKTGDFWLNGHLFGSQMCHTGEDIHHCDLLLVLGANPKLAHGFTNARDQLNGLRKDPARKLVVVDPRRSETAEAADLHIALRPGTDAFLLGALLAELMHRQAFDEAFLAAHAVGADEVKAVLAGAPAPSVADSGPALGEQLFRAVVGARSGAAFSVHGDSFALIEHPDRKLHLAVPQMLDWLRRLDPAAARPDPDWPFVLSAGQRRLNNANQILRDPGTRANDPDGALYIHSDDLAALGVADRGAVLVETARARMVVRAKATDSMRRGHVALPHGYGQRHPGADGTRQLAGPPINWLTDAAYRDPIADTPFHKHVPVRLHPAPEGAALNAVLPAGH